MIENFRFSVNAETGSDGTVVIQIKIPGTFNGIDPSSSNGRFFSSALIWTNQPTDNDQIVNLAVKDLDGVIPPAATGQFPYYPVLGYSIDPEMSYSGPIQNSILLVRNQPTQIGPSDPDLPRFFPSGMYLCATFVAGDAASGRFFYGNLLWTKKS